MEISNPEGSQLWLTLPQSSSQQEEHEEFPSRCNVKKEKASKFPAQSLKIGSWKRISKIEGDIVVKFYFARKMMVWEFLEETLKSKIEVPWSQISAIKACTKEGRKGCLGIELDQPPQFYKEIPPTPQKQSRWTKSIDFSDGRALFYRKHVVEFASGVLNKHYKKLLLCDDRLLRLSKLYPSTRNSPFFTSIPNLQPQMSDMMVTYSNEREITRLNGNEGGHNSSQDGPSTSIGELDQLVQDYRMGSHALTQPLGSYISRQDQDRLMTYHGTDSHNPDLQLGPHIPTREQNNLIFYRGNESNNATQRSGLCMPMGVQKTLIQHNETVSFYPLQQSGPSMNEEQDHTMMYHRTESHYPVQQLDCTESCNPVQEFGSHVTMGVQTSPTTYNETNSCHLIQKSELFTPLEEENKLTMYNGAEISFPVQQYLPELEYMKNYSLNDSKIQMQLSNEQRLLQHVHSKFEEIHHQIDPNNGDYMMNPMEYENCGIDMSFLFGESISQVVPDGVVLSDRNIDLTQLEQDHGTLNANQLYNSNSSTSNPIMNISSLEPNQGNQSYDYSVMLESDKRSHNTNVELPPLELDHGIELHKVVRTLR